MVTRRTMLKASAAACFAGAPASLLAQQKQGGPSPQDEDYYYRLDPLPLPDDVVLEVGGLDWLDEERTELAVCTRRGEVWKVEHPYSDPPQLANAPLTSGQPLPQHGMLEYKRMLFGLHEPLGLLTQPDGMYLAQRAELTRIADANGDDRIDIVETVCNDWEVSGSYHEYAFGPKLDRDGNMWITLNRPFGGEPEGHALWRGWAMKIDRQGTMHPVCPGLRSPAGLGMNSAGDMFYTDNQGDWVAVCKLSHLKPGSFQGNPTGLASCGHPLSPVKNPGPLPGGKMWAEAVDAMPLLVPPAVWFPYPQMGKSHSDVLGDDTAGEFGPFANQLFVGDQARSIIVRVALEKVDGEYQGACFPFREGFQCGVMRMCWGRGGTMFVGETNRGWGSTGGRPYGLERLTWTGKVPFEVHEMRAQPDGFLLTFTQPVDAATAEKVSSYALQSWTYRYHSAYGCPPTDAHALKIASAQVASDRRSVRLVVEGLQRGYVNELRLNGVRSEEGLPLLHQEAYYTLNRIPT